MTMRTVLYPLHREAGAKLVDFSGWDMPLHYGSQIEEHHRVRRDCAMFDVSHMTVVDIDGPQAEAYLRRLLANDVAKLDAVGDALYSAMLNPEGGVKDDIIAYRLASGYRLVSNCATRDKDLAWIQVQSADFEVAIRERSEFSIIALQGPQALRALAPLLSESENRQVAGLAPFQSLFFERGPEPWQLALTGYTGEQGCELLLPGSAAPEVWRVLSAVGVAPAGLAARDTLRLEAGYNLYSHEMDETVSPLCANMAWTVAFEPQERQFIGRAALEAERQRGVDEKLVGLVLEGKGVLRDGQQVSCVGCSQPGLITSGSFSPTLGYSIALARVPLAAANRGEVKMRKGPQAVRIVKPVFVRNGKALVT